MKVGGRERARQSAPGQEQSTAVTRPPLSSEILSLVGSRFSITASPNPIQRMLACATVRATRSRRAGESGLPTRPATRSAAHSRGKMPRQFDPAGRRMSGLMPGHDGRSVARRGAGAAVGADNAALSTGLDTSMLAPDAAGLGVDVSLVSQALTEIASASRCATRAARCMGFSKSTLSRYVGEGKARSAEGDGVS